MTVENYFCIFNYSPSLYFIALLALCNLVWPLTCYITENDLKPPNSPAPASEVLGLQACANTSNGLDCCSFLVSFRTRKYYFSNFLLLLKIVLVILSPLHFHINFRISLPILENSRLGF